jgi:hypothetical protein
MKIQFCTINRLAVLRELHDLHFAPDFILVIKSRRMSYMEYVALNLKSRGAYRVLVGKLREIDPFEEVVEDVRMILYIL